MTTQNLDFTGKVVLLTGSPEDIGNACLYIASPLAGYASGCNLLLHGGGESPAFLAAANSAHQ